MNRPVRRVSMLLLLAGCTEGTVSLGLDAGIKKVGDAGAKIEGCFIGRQDQPPELDIDTWSATNEIVPGPGGGQMLIVRGVPVNIGCQVKTRSQLEDICSGEIISVGERAVDLEEENDFVLSVLAVCPSVRLIRNLYDEPYRLIVMVSDENGRVIERERIITPTCGNDPFRESCLCQCNVVFARGLSCDADRPDAGTVPCP